MIHIGEKSFNSLCFIDSETEQEFTKIENIKEVNIVTETRQEYDENPHKKNHLYSENKEATMTFTTNEPFNEEEFYKMLGVDLTEKPDSYDIKFHKVVQARKHKKRRINKKWEKRYGYKIITIDSKGWIVKMNADGTTEFIKGEQ